MPLTFDQFVRRIVEAELFARGELDDFLGKLESRPADGEELAKELVRQQMLTKYQAQVAYAGDGNRLVLGNYLIGMFKDSALLATISVVELLGTALNEASRSFRYLEPMVLVGLIFLTLSLAASALLRIAETKLARR